MESKPPVPASRTLILGTVVLTLTLAACAGVGNSSSGAAPNIGAGDGLGGAGASVDGGTGGATTRPEQELDSAYQIPVGTSRFVWIANPTSGRVAAVDAQSLAVTTVEAGDAPTTISAVPVAGGGDEVVVLNALSNDATVLRADGTSLSSRTIPGVTPGSNQLVVSPAGRTAIAWTDWRRVASPRATQGFQSITVLTLGAVDPAAAPGAPNAPASAAHTTLAVGFRPVSVTFSADERRAFAVTEDGVSIISIDATGGPAVNANIALGDDPTASADTRDVSITADGRFAVVRREGSDTVSIVDLASGAITPIRLAGPVPDVDISPDGTRAVAVVRDTAQVALIPLGGAAPSAVDLTVLTIAGETIGQVVLTANGNLAVLYSNAIAAERVTVVDLAAAAAPSATPAWRTLRVHAAVLSVLASPDGRGAVVLHPGDMTSPAPSAGATIVAGAFSLLPLDGTHPALIQSTDAPIQSVSFSAAGDRALITVRDDGHQIYGVYLGMFPALEVRRYPLASPPIAAGVAAAAGRGYVAQQHPEGRITFITLDSGEARTLTGYELGARVVDWSRP